MKAISLAQRADRGYNAGDAGEHIPGNYLDDFRAAYRRGEFPEGTRVEFIPGSPHHIGRGVVISENPAAPLAADVYDISLLSAQERSGIKYIECKVCGELYVPGKLDSTIHGGYMCRECALKSKRMKNDGFIRFKRSEVDFSILD